MNAEYYRLPLQPDKLLKGEPHSRCGLKESIDQHIHLIITTAFGEMQQDESFGCSIWESDFDNLTTGSKIRERIKESVQHSISVYEQRIGAVKTEVFIKEEESHTQINGRQVKRKMDVIVTAVIKETNKAYRYGDYFFTGPLSYY